MQLFKLSPKVSLFPWQPFNPPIHWKYALNILWSGAEILFGCFCCLFRTFLFGLLLLLNSFISSVRVRLALFDPSRSLFPTHDYIFSTIVAECLPLELCTVNKNENVASLIKHYIRIYLVYLNFYIRIVCYIRKWNFLFSFIYIVITNKNPNYQIIISD